MSPLAVVIHTAICNDNISFTYKTISTINANKNFKSFLCHNFLLTNIYYWRWWKEGHSLGLNYCRKFFIMTYYQGNSENVNVMFLKGKNHCHWSTLSCFTCISIYRVKFYPLYHLKILLNVKIKIIWFTLYITIIPFTTNHITTEMPFLK